MQHPLWPSVSQPQVFHQLTESEGDASTTMLLAEGGRHPEVEAVREEASLLPASTKELERSQGRVEEGAPWL